MKEESIKHKPTLCVLDASVALSVLLPDDAIASNSKEYMKIIQNPKNEIISSSLLIFEVANGIKMALVRKRINKLSANVLIDRLYSLPVRFIDVNLRSILDTSIEFGLSIYDATYFWLAKVNNAKLLSLDKKLK